MGQGISIDWQVRPVPVQQASDTELSSSLNQLSEVLNTDGRSR